MEATGAADKKWDTPKSEIAIVMRSQSKVPKYSALVSSPTISVKASDFCGGRKSIVVDHDESDSVSARDCSRGSRKTTV
tara:strand:+ start:66 stop:302 length:237 start_codon:yes stop_codon:yes gene_type:complete